MLLLMCACHGAETTGFPAGLEPLEVPDSPAWPDSSDGSIALATGIEEGIGWGQGRSRFPFSLSDVEAAFAEPDVVVDRREVDAWSVEMGVEDYPTSFRVHNEASQLGITVLFDVTWRMAAVTGAEDDPSEVVARFQKTAGTEFIELMDGSVLLTADGTETRVELAEELDATLGDEDERIASYLTDLNASAWAYVNGEALPTYD